MCPSVSKESLIALRKHLRLTWRASVAAYYYLGGAVDPAFPYPIRVNPVYHSVEAAAYTYLATSRAFIRTADKVAGAINIKDLQEYSKNLYKEFPGHKNARDILEHFEDYALGTGKLQQNGKIFVGESISVCQTQQKLIVIQVFDLEPIEISKFAWWIDGFNFFLERSLHEVLEPNVEWKGFWPQYDYIAPPDWQTR